jgi:hypothetical protein
MFWQTVGAGHLGREEDGIKVKVSVVSRTVEKLVLYE